MATMLEKAGHRAAGLAVATALAGAAVYAVLFASKPPPAHSRKIIPSPRTTLLPRLSQDQIVRLAYSPTALPGGRDVDTPFGYMRVYEWGPETGRKVLFVHGDGTPAPVFRPIAEELVARGCRVMAFDLWGRGYSDTPVDCQHDCRLYTLQILYALISSPIAWGASNPFSVAGYSMGGTIVLDFFAHNPGMVESIILLGPGGMIRELPAGYKSFWYRHPALSQWSTVRRLIGNLFQLDTAGSFPKSEKEIRFTNQGFTPTGACQFQFDHHHGHIVSFLSTIHYAPLQHQEHIWRQVGDVLKEENSCRAAGTSPQPGIKLLCFCGEDDDLVVPSEVKQGLDTYIGGPNYFEYKTVPGGHGFLWTEGPAIADHMLGFWDRNMNRVT